MNSGAFHPLHVALVQNDPTCWGYVNVSIYKCKRQTTFGCSSGVFYSAKTVYFKSCIKYISESLKLKSLRNDILWSIEGRVTQLSNFKGFLRSQWTIRSKQSISWHYLITTIISKSIRKKTEVIFNFASYPLRYIKHWLREREWMAYNSCPPSPPPATNQTVWLCFGQFSDVSAQTPRSTDLTHVMF